MATAKYGQNDTMVQKAVRGLSQNKVWKIEVDLQKNCVLQQIQNFSSIKKTFNTYTWGFYFQQVSKRFDKSCGLLNTCLFQGQSTILLVIP